MGPSRSYEGCYLNHFGSAKKNRNTTAIILHYRGERFMKQYRAHGYQWALWALSDITVGSMA